MAMQLLVSAVGIAAMTATAALLFWYKAIDGGRRRPPDADIAGGDV